MNSNVSKHFLINTCLRISLLYKRGEKIRGTILFLICTKNWSYILSVAWFNLNRRRELVGNSYLKNLFFTYLLGQAISVQRLYGYGNSHVAGRSFWKMLFWVIENIDNLEISEELVRIGGCHSIYGVTEEEYKAFASSLCNCIKDIIGEKHFGIETVEAWHAVFNCISDLMIKVGETTKQGFKGELRRLRENHTWGTKYITLMPETIYLYKDYERTDLYGQFPLRDITIQDHNDVPYSFKLSSFDPPFLLTLAALDEKQYNKWLIEIDWRVTALHHLYKDHDSEGMSHCDDLGETGQVTGKRNPS
eukprot:TRINITY_DN7988_c0_g1_i8.p1 TRINITY_DN7988_c0_g1~~TRINITY_DN7988_c0_g1_i8.p1  ORF type:complete len:305 (+),score=45.30 TRINITY_DN7988_c0_g1_i8:283-1197(+)